MARLSFESGLNPFYKNLDFQVFVSTSTLLKSFSVLEYRIRGVDYQMRRDYKTTSKIIFYAMTIASAFVLKMD